MPIQRPLTPRQHVILRSVARGRTNKDIAAELGISEQGVKVHISRLLERYGAENRVELVSLTRAWSEADGPHADLSTDIAGIRSGLQRSFQDVTAFGKVRSGDGHSPAPAASRDNNGHSAPPTSGDLSAEVRALRDVLAEINVALKIARELPADANVGPIVDAIRNRVGVALSQSERLDALVADRRSMEQSRQTAS